MKFAHYVLCLIIGHNKVLQKNDCNGYYTYFTICVQCNKKWKNKSLSEPPKSFKVETVTLKAQRQDTIIKTKNSKKINKIFKVNFYAL